MAQYISANQTLIIVTNSNHADCMDLLMLQIEFDQINVR